METLSNTTPKAIKEHQCNYCGEKINKGEKYNSQTNVYDGDIYTWKSHKNCTDIASELRMHDECDEGVTGEDFRESIQYAYQDIMINTDIDYYESKEFKYPTFVEQLKVVCDTKLNG